MTSIHDVPNKSQPCPTCRKNIPVFKNERIWCSHCEWNLTDESNIKPKTPYEEIYRKLGKSVGQNLYDTLLKKEAFKPKLTLTKFAAYAFSIFIHFVTLMTVMCIVLPFFWFHYAMASLFSGVCALITWNLRPRLRRWPKKEILSRAEYPCLYFLVDEVADKIGTSRVAGLTIDGEYNAYYTEFGFGPWKKKLICLGLPLLETLPTEEIVALIAHEVSHGANGDIARGALIGSGLNTLARWYQMLHPRSIHEGYMGRGNHLVVMLSNLFGGLLSMAPWTGYYVLARLLLRESQRCEYLADRLATEVSGSHAMTSLLSSLWHSDSFYLSVQRAALSRGERQVFDLVREKSSYKKSYNELERLDRIEKHTGLSLDATHPPTRFRQNFIDSLEVNLPKIVITEDQRQKLRAELEPQRKIVSDKLIDGYLNRLY